MDGNVYKYILYQIQYINLKFFDGSNQAYSVSYTGSPSYDIGDNYQDIKSETKQNYYFF